MNASIESSLLNLPDPGDDQEFTDPVDGGDFAQNFNPGESQPPPRNLLQSDLPAGVSFGAEQPTGDVARDFGSSNAPSFSLVDTSALLNPETRDLHNIYLGGNDGLNNPLDDALLAFSPNPEETQAAAMNLRGIASMEGVAPEAIAPAFPVLQNLYSWTFLNRPATNIELANHFTQELTNQDELADRASELAGKVALPSPAQENSPDQATVSQWKNTLPPSLQPKVDVGSILQNISEVRNQLAPFVGDARTVYVGLTEPDNAPTNDFMPLLAGKSRDDRMKIYGLVDLLAQQNGKMLRNFWQQEQLSILRSTARMQGAVSRMGEEARIYREMSLLRDRIAGKATTEDAANFLQSESQSGRLPNDRLAFWSGEVNGTNTSAARQARLAQLQSQLNETEVAREIEQLVNGQIDPIKPLAKGLLGRFEQGAYDAGGALPGFAVSAIPYVGLPLAIETSTALNYDQLRTMEPDLPIPQAQGVSVARGVVQGVLSKVRVSAIMGHLPVTGRLIAALGWGSRPLFQRVAISAGLNLAEQYGLMTAQNATPLVIDATAKALGADMPGYDWNKELTAFQGAQASTFFALLPYWLAGAGGITWREASRGRETDQAILNSLGISPEKAGEIINEKDPMVQEQKFRTAWSGVSEEEKGKTIRDNDARSREPDGAVEGDSYKGPRVNALLAASADEAKYTVEEAAKGIVPHSLDDLEARDWYEGREKYPGKNSYIRKALESAQKRGDTREQQALFAFSLRNAFRDKGREIMSNRKSAEKLEAKEKNYTWEDIYKRYNGDYDRIIGGAEKSRVGVYDELRRNNSKNR